ncbi:hypothetical protein KFU94_18445 [Chloroflexi bacterium TSY]|nr:hypothetical protein [Chloroflexi bacterium TSY]
MSVQEETGHLSNVLLRQAFLVIVGILSLVIGARWLVDSAEVLARAVGISELVIGLTLVALGTSLPEIATTVVAILRGESDLAIGNVVGSNLFNMLLIGGVSALVRPLQVPAQTVQIDIPVMAGMSLLGYFLLVPRPHTLERWEAIILLLSYGAYIVWLFL